MKDWIMGMEKVVQERASELLDFDWVFHGTTEKNLRWILTEGIQTSEARIGDADSSEVSEGVHYGTLDVAYHFAIDPESDRDRCDPDNSPVLIAVPLALLEERGDLDVDANIIASPVPTNRKDELSRKWADVAERDYLACLYIYGSCVHSLPMVPEDIADRCKIVRTAEDLDKLFQ